MIQPKLQEAFFRHWCSLLLSKHPLSLGFEYQGQQHFHPIKAWGGERALKNIKERDARKAEICKQIGVKLIIVSYTEPLTEGHIRKVLVEQSLVTNLSDNAD